LVALLAFVKEIELAPGHGLFVFVLVREFQVTKLVLRKSKKEEVVAWLVQLETKLDRSASLVPPFAKVPIRMKLLAGRLLPLNREIARFVPAGSMEVKITSLAAFTCGITQIPPNRRKQRKSSWRIPLDKTPPDKYSSRCLVKALPKVLLRIKSFQSAKLRVSEIEHMRKTMLSLKPAIQIILVAGSPAIEL
jgi:hypothetical protein